MESTLPPHCGQVLLQHLDQSKYRFMFGSPQLAWAKAWGKLSKDIVDEHVSNGGEHPHREMTKAWNKIVKGCGVMNLEKATAAFDKELFPLVKVWCDKQIAAGEPKADLLLTLKRTWLEDARVAKLSVLVQSGPAAIAATETMQSPSSMTPSTLDPDAVASTVAAELLTSATLPSIAPSMVGPEAMVPPPIHTTSSSPYNDPCASDEIDPLAALNTFCKDIHIDTAMLGGTRGTLLFQVQCELVKMQDAKAKAKTWARGTGGKEAPAGTRDQLIQKLEAERVNLIQAYEQAGHAESSLNELKSKVDGNGHDQVPLCIEVAKQSKVVHKMWFTLPSFA